MSVGNIEAIKDWLQTNYSLSYKQKALETYFTKYYITFSGVPYETVTATNGSFLLDPISVTLDENGIATTEAYFLPGDTVTFTGSHLSYEKQYTFGLETTNVLIRIMPEGALFWYGNQCVDVTGGWELVKLANNVNPNSEGIVTYNTSSRSAKVSLTNTVQSTSTITSTMIFKPINKINISNYNKAEIYVIRSGWTSRSGAYASNINMGADLLIDDYMSITGRSAKTRLELHQNYNTQPSWKDNYNSTISISPSTYSLVGISFSFYKKSPD